MKIIKQKLILLLLFVCTTVFAQTTREWVQHHSEPNFANNAFASFVDKDGNSYITGGCNYWGCDNEMDMVTVKYDKNGALQWINNVNGEADANDEGNDVTVDSDGNVYVAGYVDALLNLDDYAVVKYDAAGNLIWEATYNSPPSAIMPFHDKATHIFVDDDRNVYVTGICGEYDEAAFYIHWNIGTVKFDPNGNLLWSQLYNTPGNQNDYPIGIRVNQYGHVFVAGYSIEYDPASEMQDWIVLMYDSNGNLVWDDRYNGPQNEDDIADVLTIDRFGDLYVAGSRDKMESGSEMYLVKYDTRGNVVWTDVEDFGIPGLGGFHVSLSDMKIDENDNLFISGTDFYTRNVLMKYNLTGNQEWLQTWETGFTNSELCFDSENNIYLSGDEWTTEGTILKAAKYNQAGTFLWEIKYEDGIEDDDGPWSNYTVGIGVDAENSIYLTGTAGSGGRSYVVVKYSQVTSVAEISSLVSEFKLLPNYPNPFNPQTSIRFDLAQAQVVSLTIYDITGRVVNELIQNEQRNAGLNTVVWNGLDRHNIPVSSGIYFYQLKTPAHSMTKRCVLQK